MADEYASTVEALSDPADRLVAVAPHDTNNLADIPKALWIGTQGHVAIIANDDNSPVTMKNVQGLLPVRAKRVLVTGTTASDIVALY